MCKGCCSFHLNECRGDGANLGFQGELDKHLGGGFKFWAMVPKHGMGTDGISELQTSSGPVD